MISGRYAVLILTAGGLASPVHADGVVYEPVVVTATRLNQDSANIPANVTIISAKDIRESAATTLPELLGLQAGVGTRSLYGNNAARSTVDIRGFGASATQNTLILLDGRRLNDIDLSAVDFAAIPLRDIKRIEIIRGGGGVLYGDGAVGGTINIITKGPGKTGSHGDATIGVGSYDTEQLDASMRSSNDSGAWNLYASGLHSGGYRDNNNLRQLNLQGGARWFKPGAEWFLKFGADDQRLRLPGSRTVDPSKGINQLENDRRGTSTPNDYANQNGYYLSGGMSHYLQSNTKLVVDVGYRGKNQRSYFDYGGGYSNYIDANLDTWSLTPRLTHEYGTGAQHGTLTAGVDVYSSQYGANRGKTATTRPIHILDVTELSTAAYVHDSRWISKVTNITAGIRLQRVRLSARDHYDASAPGGSSGSQAADLDKTDDSHMLELGVRHHLSHSLSVFSRVSRSVRFATIDETFQAPPPTYSLEFTPLKPQTAMQFDLGTDFRHGRTQASADLYYMRLKNEIHYDPSASANVNLDPTRRYGVELSSTTSLTDVVKLKADYTYTRSEFRAGRYAGHDVPLVPRHTARLSVFWDMRPNLRLTSTLRYVGTKRFDNDQANTFAKIPAYTMVDLKLAKRHGPWRVSGEISNLFNTKAYDTGIISTSTAGRYSAYPLPERSFMVSVERSF